MICTLSKPKVKPGCTLTKGIPCALNKPLLPPCTTIKPKLVQCKLTKPYCKPIVKMKQITCPVKPACKPTVKVRPVVCSTLIKPKCKPGIKVNPNVPLKAKMKVCTTVKQNLSVTELCRVTKPQICIGTKPKPICLNQPNSSCRLAMPKCPKIMKPTQIHNRRRDT